MADVDDFIARHKQRLAQHQRELDEVEDTAPQQPQEDAPPQQLYHHHASSGFAEDELSSGVAANPHGHTWADAGRASAVRSSDGPGSAAREFRNHPPARAAPAVAAGSPARSSTSTRYLREYVIDSPTSVYDRSQRWASQRDKAVARQRDEKGALETSDCTFQPSRAAVTPGKSTGVSARRKRAASGDSPRVDAASYYQHIQRQEGARRDRDDQKRKVAVDTAAWRNRTTTPREFTFGQRKGHISSLRKPCVGLTPRDVQSHSEKQWASEEADEIDISEDETSAAAAKSTRAVPAQQQQQQQQQQQPQTSRQTASSSSATRDDEAAMALERANADIVKLTKELMHMRSKSDRQEEEIARLGGSVVSLKRELDAAKAKLRHYALGGQ